MSKPVSAFLNDVVNFLNTEVILDPYSKHRYFDSCEARVNDIDEIVKIRFLSYCRKNPDGYLEEVNEVLSKSEIQVEFHFIDDVELTNRWTNFLSQIGIKLEVPEVDPPPPVLKWEARGDEVGNLKHDEWHGPEEEYIQQNISARKAIKNGVEEQLYRILPKFKGRSSVRLIPDIDIKVLYNEVHDILDELEPYDQSE